MFSTVATRNRTLQVIPLEIYLEQGRNKAAFISALRLLVEILIPQSAPESLIILPLMLYSLVGFDICMDLECRCIMRAPHAISIYFFIEYGENTENAALTDNHRRHLNLLIRFTNKYFGFPGGIIYVTFAINLIVAASPSWEIFSKVVPALLLC
jgi:hypothetical protein